MNKVNFSIQVCPKSAVPPFNYHFPIQLKCPECTTINFRAPHQDTDVDIIVCSECGTANRVQFLIATAMKVIKY